MKYTRNMRELATLDKSKIKVIGLTGGIASGKTLATSALSAAGYTVIDADEISRELFAAKTDGEKNILRLFPQAGANGKLDRAVLRKIIATDAKARTALNELTHPDIIAEIERRLKTAKPPIILSAPLLFESGLSALCDVTVCVYCPRDVRINRLIKRDNATYDDAAQMIDAQIPDYERCTIADFIVPNGDNINEFTEEITELIREIFKH